MGCVDPKTAQELMRHSTISLTMDLYTRVQKPRLSQAIDAAMPHTRPEPEAQNEAETA